MKKFFDSIFSGLRLYRRIAGGCWTKVWHNKHNNGPEIWIRGRHITGQGDVVLEVEGYEIEEAKLAQLVRAVFPDVFIAPRRFVDAEEFGRYLEHPSHMRGAESDDTACIVDEWGMWLVGLNSDGSHTSVDSRESLCKQGFMGRIIARRFSLSVDGRQGDELQIVDAVEPIIQAENPCLEKLVLSAEYRNTLCDIARMFGEELKALSSEARKKIRGQVYNNTAPKKYDAVWEAVKE